MKETVKIVVNPRYPGLLPLVERLALHGEPAEARVIYDQRNRLYAIPWPVDADGKPYSAEIVVKDFHRPSAVNALVYTHLRKSKARRSYENALQLQSLGFGTPEPYAYIEVHRGMKLTRSYYLCARLTDDYRDMRFFDRQPHLMELLDALGAEMLRLHRAGVLVKDFSPGNVLYVRDAQGDYHFSHIDLNRVRFGVRSRSQLMGNFRAMACAPDEVDSLADAYARATGETPESVRAEAQAQYEAYMRKVRRKRALKSIFRRKK